MNEINRFHLFSSKIKIENGLRNVACVEGWGKKEKQRETYRTAGIRKRQRPT